MPTTSTTTARGACCWLPEVDTAKPPPIAHCKGGIGAKALSFCYYNDFGNEIENNTLSHNGFFGNPSNVDLAEISNLAYPGNCFHGNVDTSGTAINATPLFEGRPRVTSDPLLHPVLPPRRLRNPGQGQRDH